MSCQRLSAKPGECDSSYVTALGIITAGSLPKVSNEVGYKTQNPELDGVRKAQLLQELQAEAKIEGPPVDLPPEPDWLGTSLPLDDAVAAFSEPPEVAPVWVDDAIAAPEVEEALRDSFRDAIAAGEVSAVTVDPSPEPEPEKDPPLAVRMARAAAKLELGCS